MGQELARGGTMMSPISFYGKGIAAVESSYLIVCAVSRMLVSCRLTKGQVAVATATSYQELRSQEANLSHILCKD